MASPKRSSKTGSEERLLGTRREERNPKKTPRAEKERTFIPKPEEGIPVPIEDLLDIQKVSRKRTGKGKENHEEEVRSIQGWKRGFQGVSSTSYWWRGVAEMYLKKRSLEEEEVGQKMEVWATGLSQEVDMSKESTEDLEEWKVQDAAEWNKIGASGAARPLSVEEPTHVREDLRKQGKLDRILPTKMARRYKPAEQPGELRSKKSRLCVRGDKDPYILELERFSPTVNTMKLNVMLQIAVNEGMEMGIGALFSH